MSAVREAAIAAHRAGLCVVPPAEDGSKEPLGARQKWKHFQERRPTSAELNGWYTETVRSGLGAVTGRISRNLQLFEFDCRATYESFVALAQETGLGDLVEVIEGGYAEDTPAGGRHWLFHCEEIGRNTELARRPRLAAEMRHKDDKVRVLIETKEEGGYVILAPSNGRVHPTGKPYRLVSGSFATISTITPEERGDLYALARTFDQMPAQEERHQEGERSGATDVRPGDDFNARACWDDVLLPHGWKRVSSRGELDHWRRPGKDRGISATTNYQGSGLLYVFSTSTPFEAERGYNRFSGYAVLNHHGDFRAAAKVLAANGYGTPKNDSQGTDNTDSRGSGRYGSATEEPIESAWPERQPLPSPMPAAPTLPARMIPDPLRPWIEDIGARACLPLEMVAAPAVAAAAAVIGRKIGIRPGRFDDFTVVPNLWGADVARPGWMKSNAVKEGFGPIGKLAAKARERYEAEREEGEIEVAALNAQLKAIESRMNEAAKKGGDLATLKEEYREKRAELKAAIPTERRYLTHDVTVEKLGELLRDNPRGMLLLRDELSGWLRSLDKPGREGDREFFLESWNGTGSFTTDRIGRGTIHIPALTLSVFGGIQPGKLQPLVAGAVEGGAGDDGLLQRLQVLVYPDRLDPWKKPDRWPEASARDRAFAVFEGLDTITQSAVGAESDDIPYLRFTQGAQAIHDAWRDALEGRLRSGELDNSPAFAAHIAKYRSLMPALALVFHLIDVVTGIVRGSVGEAPTRLAAAWCEFLECHARKVYAVELDGGVSAAIALAAKVEVGAVLDGQSVRELYRAQWAGLRSPERVLLALTTLADLSWVRLASVVRGGRPSQIVRLHPDLRAAVRDEEAADD